MKDFTLSFLGAITLALPGAAQSSSWTQVGPTGVYTFRTSPDYASDGRVWIATGTESFSGDGAIHLSTDHGNTFGLQSMLPGAAPETQALAVSPTYALDSTLFATSFENLVPNSILWKSTDGGASWNSTPQPSALSWGNRFKTITLSPEYATLQTILASCFGIGCHNQVSSNGGSNWSLVPFPQGLRDLEFAPDFATSGLAYGARRVSNSFFTSDDFGQTFSQCSNGLGSPLLCAALDECWGIAVAPVGSLGERTIYYFGKPDPVFYPPNFLRSLDGGTSWNVAGAGLDGLEVYDVVVAPDFLVSGRLYAATSNGVWFSDDTGTSFAPLAGSGLPSPVVHLELAGGVGGDLYALAGGTPDPQVYGVAGGGIANPHDVYRLCLGGTGFGCQSSPVANFCFGDGGDQLGCTDCPCGNNAAPGTIGGCVNSANTSTRLLLSGDPSVSLPAAATTDLRFSATGLPPNSFCILNSGDNIAPQNMANACFGLNSGVTSASFDGLRCAVGNAQRHGGRSADTNGEVGVTTSPWGGEAGPSAGIGPLAGFGAGQTRYFQVVHRDNPLLACMTGLGTSQAVEVVFAP